MKEYLNFFRNLDKLQIAVFIVLTVFVVLFGLVAIYYASKGNILCV